jgi:hypothetical protein
MKNKILALPAAFRAMPPNPKTAAINAMMKKAKCPPEHFAFLLKSVSGTSELCSSVFLLTLRR